MKQFAKIHSDQVLLDMAKHAITNLKETKYTNVLGHYKEYIENLGHCLIRIEINDHWVGISVYNISPSYRVGSCMYKKHVKEWVPEGKGNLFKKFVTELLVLEKMQVFNN